MTLTARNRQAAPKVPWFHRLSIGRFVGSIDARVRSWWLLGRWKITPLQQRQPTRIKVAAAGIVLVFVLALSRMVMVVLAEPREPGEFRSSHNQVSVRRDIVDRNGVILATSVPAMALYAHPRQIVSYQSAVRLASRLSEIFPDLDYENTLDKLSSDKSFVWLRHKMSQGQYQAVHDIGEPGLYFRSKELRVYPNGNLAAHVLGSARDGVSSKNPLEVLGVSGAEHSLDAALRDQGKSGEPVALTIDTTLQEISHSVLTAASSAFGAKGASSVLMDVHSGEVLSLVSIPDFDPNDSKRFAALSGGQSNPLFNRPVQGIYEFGSVFKVFPVAMVLDRGTIGAEDLVSIEPFAVGRYTIKDHFNKQSELTVRQVLTKSSNTGVARLALLLKPGALGEFLRELGFTEASHIEILEAKSVRSRLPDRWTTLNAVTVSYGHGVALTQLKLAAAYAAIVNGGYLVEPTIVLDEGSYGTRRSVISPETSAIMRDLLQSVVAEGTARAAQIEGYPIGGKTGTADKPDKRGKYSSDRTLASFASFFPADDPRYVLIVTLDEPSTGDGTRSQRFAGKTAVPTAKEMMARLMPVLGIRPRKPVPESQQILAN